MFMDVLRKIAESPKDAVDGVETSSLKQGVGSDTLSVYAHTVRMEGQSGIERKIVEKRLSKRTSGKEILTYKTLFQHGGMSLDAGATHPEVLGIIEKEDIVSVFMEYIEGEELVLSPGNARRVGRSLGQMSSCYADVFKDEPPFDHGRVRDALLEVDETEIFGILDSDELAKSFCRTMDEYAKVRPDVLLWQQQAQRVF
jgi:hypothetical protein